MGLGGRVPGFWVSARAVALAAAVSFGSLSFLLTPPAEAQGAFAKWYGPADASKPAEGWAFRVPIAVENAHEIPLRSPQVVTEIDVGKLLIQAGWTNQTTGRDVLPRGFTLDVASVRVVEYEPGYRDYKDATPRETPHLFYPSLFESPMRGRAFNASTNPVGTLVWFVKGDLAPAEKRYYYVYFNAREYGSVSAPTFTEKDLGPVNAYPYAGMGQVFYWYENGATGGTNRLDVYAYYEETEVAIYREELLGQYRLARLTGLTGDHRNPDVLRNATNSWRYTYALPQNSWYKLVASKPVTIGSHGNAQQPPGGGPPTQWGAGAFVPARSGGYAGREFTVPYYASALRYYAVEPGTTTVMKRVVNGADPEGTPAGVVSLTPASPSRLDSFPTPDFAASIGTYIHITSDRPILVQYDGYEGQVHPMPALSGALTGTAFAFRARNEEVVQVRALDATAVRIVDPASSTTQIYPPGARTEPAGPVVPGCSKESAGLDLSVNATWVGQPPVEARSEPLPGVPGASAALLAVESAGKAGRTAGFYGGQGGQRVLATGPVSVVGHYNETRLTVIECTSKGPVTRQISVQRDGRFQLEGPGTRSNGGKSLARYEILSNKPVSVFATTVADHYARVVPGRPLALDGKVGALEFRGHLVDLQSAERPGRQVFKTTGPAKPVEFKLTAFNLGQWIGGANLPDTITITCTPFLQWEISGCGLGDEAKQLTLASKTSQSFFVTVKPRNAGPNDRGEILVTATSSTTGMKAQILLVVVVEVTYDVGMWFDFVGALKRIDPPRSVERGESTTYTVVVKNLGSVRDTYEIEKSEPADAQGWSSRLVRPGADDEEVERLSLNPDQTATLLLKVDSPPRELGEGISNFFDVVLTATSVSSQAAASTVTASTRIRADIQFSLTVDEPTKLAEPGKAARFTLSLLNKGTDIARIALTREGVLPPGWETRLLSRDGAPFTDIDLTPNAALNVTLEVTPPADARAGDLATSRIGARTTVGDETRSTEESATVVVRQVHNLSFSEPAEIPAVPGEEIRYALELTNVGNGDELAELVPSSVRPAWPVRGVGGEGLSIGRGDAGVLDLSLKVPEATPAGLYEVNFSLRLSREALQNVTIPVLVREVRQLAFDLPSALRVSPGQEFAFPLDVRNTGNVKDVATLAAALPAGWVARFDPPSVFLAPGQSTRVSVVVNASREARESDFPVTLKAAFSNGGRESERAATVAVAKPDLVLGEALTQGSTRAGDVLVVSIPVGNRGTMEAVDVRVALLVNDRPVDTVTLARVPAGAERLATLKYRVEEKVESVKVVVNPDGRVVEGDESGREASVSFATAGRIPAPGAALALAALAALALAFPRVPRRRSP